MLRREFLTTTIGGLAALPAAPALAVGREVPIKTTSSGLPRKVIVGTMMQAFWVEHPGLQTRLQQLAGFVDRMAEKSRKQYGRSLDLAILPEVAITGEAGNDVSESAVPLEGPVLDTFSRKARELNTYIVVPTYLLESKERKLCSNAAVLIGRKGEVAGTYRKVQLVVDLDTGSMEGGCAPGMEVPVFKCDFGKLGIQICYDMDFDYSWAELARKGAELIAWPTQSPQTSQPAARARKNRAYIVSSTWRHNASIFEPTGKIAAQIKPPESVLVQELDLSYAIIGWSSTLKKGEAFKSAFGDRAGYHYYEDEDCGIFWSNDPKTSVGQMARSLGQMEIEEEFARVRQCYRKAGVPGYR